MASINLPFVVSTTQNNKNKMAKENLIHTVSLVVGDWSHDGHGKTDVVVINSNKTGDQIKGAYSAAVKMTGLNLGRQCEEYEDSKFKPAFVRKCKELFANQPDALSEFVDVDDPEADAYDEEEFYVDSDQFARIYLFIARMMLGDLEWEISRDNTSRINIGGYGLFWS